MTLSQAAEKPDRAVDAAIASRSSSARSQNHGDTQAILRVGNEPHEDNLPGRRPSLGERRLSIIWDGGLRCFNGGPLREAMLVRGLTPDEVAASAQVSRGTLYNALNGRPTRQRTARRILEVLASVEPTLRLSSLTEEP